MVAPRQQPAVFPLPLLHKFPAGSRIGAAIDHIAIDNGDVRLPSRNVVGNGFQCRHVAVNVRDECDFHNYT